MRAFQILQGQDQIPDMRGPVRVRAILPAAGDIQLRHVGIERGIGLVEDHAAGHVEDVLDGRAAIGCRLQFRKVVRQERGGVDHAAIDQDARHGADDRFGDRLRQVLGVWRHSVEVALSHDLSAVERQEAIGIARFEEAGDGVALPLRREGNGIDIPQIDRQRACRPHSAPDLRGRQKLSDMLEGPAIPGRAVPILPWNMGIAGYGRIAEGRNGVHAWPRLRLERINRYGEDNCRRRILRRGCPYRSSWRSCAWPSARAWWRRRRSAG